MEGPDFRFPSIGRDNSGGFGDDEDGLVELELVWTQ